MVSGMNPEIKVSVVIPKRKGEDISSRVEAVERSTYKNGYEYKLQVVIVNWGEERSRQRNVGIGIAEGGYVLWLDSDQMVSPDLIGECVYLMQRHPDCGGLYLPEVIVGKGWFTRLRNFERKFYNGTAVDCVRFVRRPCPLFDEGMSGPEDTDFDRRIQGKKAITRNPLYHFDNITLRDYIRKKAYYTQSMARFIERNPNDKILNLRWRCFGVFVENGKWKELLKHPLKTLGLAFLLGVRGVIYLWKK